MNIPDKAVELVARDLALLDDGDEWPTNEALGGSLTGTRDDEFRFGMEIQARELLELAAPFIAAQALRDEAERIEALDKDSGPERVRAYLRAKSLRLSANRLEGPK